MYVQAYLYHREEKQNSTVRQRLWRFYLCSYQEIFCDTLYIIIYTCTQNFQVTKWFFVSDASFTYKLNIIDKNNAYPSQNEYWAWHETIISKFLWLKNICLLHLIYPFSLITEWWKRINILSLIWFIKVFCFYLALSPASFCANHVQGYI